MPSGAAGSSTPFCRAKVYAVIGVYVRRCVETGKMRGSILREAYLIRRKAFAENVAVIVGVCKPFNGHAFAFEVYAEFAFYCAQSALQGRFPRAGAQRNGRKGQQNNNIFELFMRALLRCVDFGDRINRRAAILARTKRNLMQILLTKKFRNAQQNGKSRRVVSATALIYKFIP